ncbi:hypothetical protein AV530_003235 [Patagioenas fasciata monilis]|uniref:Uncharacterized protein n=1 Tax=Patagioenas fasciata monilis TaxID=372326 RepID=A0A1V4KWA3_PATFA|nr:hypothetical protein AV530_003235 [Patagioenas fasciata monilis]
MYCKEALEPSIRNLSVAFALPLSAAAGMTGRQRGEKRLGEPRGTWRSLTLALERPGEISRKFKTSGN